MRKEHRTVRDATHNVQSKLLAKHKQEYDKAIEELDAKYKEAEIARLAAYTSYKETSIRIHQRLPPTYC